MDDVIIVINKVEDDSYEGKEFKKVTDKAGKVWKIKQGREGALKDKWGLLEPGVALRVTLGTFKDKEFVKDIELVKDVFVAQAAEKAQTMTGVQTDITRNATMLLSYAKDLCVAGKIEVGEILPEADCFLNWLEAKLSPSKPTSEPIKTPQQGSEGVSVVYDKDWLIENLEQLGKVNPLAYQNLMLNLKKKGYVEGGSVSDFILNQEKAQGMANYIKGKLNE